MLKQRLQQKLLLKLSPQQIQFQKLLAVPTMALEQRIKEEIEENPALEEGSDEEPEVSEDEIKDLDGGDEENPEDGSMPDDEFDLQEYMDDDYIPGYRMSANNKSPDDDDDQKSTPLTNTVSFQDTLITQLGLRELTEKQYQIGLYIIGNIDDSGYLKRDPKAMVDDLAFSQNLSSTEQEVTHVMQIIQEFDPAGVGGRDLQECLLIQLRRIEDPDDNVLRAIAVLEQCYEDFIKKHFDRITEIMTITEEELKAVYEVITGLNPKPGNSFNETSRTIQYIIPDFILTSTNGQLDFVLNTRNIPELHINRSYSEMMENLAQNPKNLSTEQKNLLFFVKQKIDSAHWFIDMLRQRHLSMYNVMKAIMDFQKDYFATGDDACLKPMRLKDIAEKVNLDVSTISRIANSKYVQTPYGTLSLKSFFSDSIQTDSGEEVATKEVKNIVMECVHRENKQEPLTDEQLMSILKEKGFSLARRTIAKYREQLGIPVARLRKEL